MTHLTPRSLVAIVAVASLTGCAVTPDDDASDEAANTEASSSALTRGEENPPGSGVCPPAKLAPEMQRKVSQAFLYVIGGAPERFFDDNRCIGDEYPEDLRSSLYVLKGLLAKDLAYLGPASGTKVCGLAAGQREIRIGSDAIKITSIEQAVKNIGVYADKCWGTGASAFAFLGSDEASVWFDPEPAKLTQSLSGTTGATAAAVLVNSGTPVDVVKWTTAYNPNTTLVAGTPCATTALSSSTQTLKIIQATGNYRRCL